MVVETCHEIVKPIPVDTFNPPLAGMVVETSLSTFFWCFVHTFNPPLAGMVVETSTVNPMRSLL